MTPDPRLVVFAEIPGEPFPAERPRFARSTGHAYVPSTTTKVVRAIAGVLRARCPIPERALPVEVELVFRRASHTRVDVDNLAKTVLDACKGVVWKDDDQVIRLVVTKRLGCGRAAGTTLVVRRVLPHELPTDPEEGEA